MIGSVSKLGVYRQVRRLMRVWDGRFLSAVWGSLSPVCGFKHIR